MIACPQRLVLVISAAWCLLSASVSSAKEPEKRLIAAGWDSPNAAYFRRHVAEFERGSFDGTVIRPTRIDGKGTVVDANFAFSREHWEAGEFAQTIIDLQMAEVRTATENFLLVNANPGDVDWFDDEGWKEIVAHWRLLARVAKAGRLKGIMFDCEAYTANHRQFSYLAQAGHSRRTFSEYSEHARRRGREVMSAVAEEYPDIIIFGFMLLSPFRSAVHAKGTLEKDGLGLLPSFIDGWLDVMPRTARMIDGNEASYRYNSQVEFKSAYRDLKQDVWFLISPANHARFRECWQVGQAIYLDAYCDSPLGSWSIAPLTGTRLERLEANVRSALGSTDRYVWVYGETGRWWKTGADIPLWTEKLPGVEGALQRAKGNSGGPAPVYLKAASVN